MKTDLFQSCGHCWVFQICWHIECNTFTASSFRIWNSSTGILSPPLALFVVMLSKAHLTSYSRMSGSRSVITPSLLSGSIYINPSLPVHPTSPSPLASTFVLYVCDPISALQISSSVPFLDSTCKQYYTILKISSRPCPQSLMAMGPAYQTPSSSDHHRQFPFLRAGLLGFR